MEARNIRKRSSITGSETHSCPFISYYRDSSIASRLTKGIASLARKLDEIGRKVRIMNFCGTHEYTITFYGIRSLMPHNVELVAGPGCPVCIVPSGYIDAAISLAKDGVLVLTYGDMYRVPGSKLSLAQARSEGAKVRIVYSFLDAIRVAKAYGKECVFFAVGFETTQPTVASRILRGHVPRNLKILTAYRLIPPVMRYLLEVKSVKLDGVIAPGHVSTIIGASAWSFLPEEYGIPTVVAGFEPVDVLIAILEILKQLVERRPQLYNEYYRVVTWEGNKVAQHFIQEVFEKRAGGWRGIGIIPNSALGLKKKFRSLDAAEAYGLKVSELSSVHPGCRCPEVIMGKIYPTDCPLFLKGCSPQRPLGPCMVSMEGTCSIWARYGSNEVLNTLGIKRSTK